MAPGTPVRSDGIRRSSPKRSVTALAGAQSIRAAVWWPSAYKIEYLSEEGFLPLGGGGSRRHPALGLAAPNVSLRSLPPHTPHEPHEGQTYSQPYRAMMPILSAPPFSKNSGGALLQPLTSAQLAIRASPDGRFRSEKVSSQPTVTSAAADLARGSRKRQRDPVSHPLPDWQQSAHKPNFGANRNLPSIQLEPTAIWRPDWTTRAPQFRQFQLACGPGRFRSTT